MSERRLLCRARATELIQQAYTGIGERVGDFVKRYKDMQAELEETKRRLDIAEGYQAKYETLKAEMDEILGNA